MVLAGLVAPVRMGVEGLDSGLGGSPYPRAEASSLQPHPPSGLSGWPGPTLGHSSLQPCSPWPPPGAALLCSPGHEGMTT